MRKNRLATDNAYYNTLGNPSEYGRRQYATNSKLRVEFASELK
jgi:hypothetical protein